MNATADRGWRKSSRSADTANCVEVRLSGCVGVRDSKDPDGAVLEFTADAWREFVQMITQ